MKSIRTEDTDNYGNVVEMKKRVPFFLWIGITAILLAAAVVVTVAILTKGSDPASYEEKMDLGRKYLLELDYDQAILAFEEAIKINPKKKDAYLELAEVYVETGEPEKAVKILEKAEKKVQDEDDLEEITEKKDNIVDEELDGVYPGDDKDGKDDHGTSPTLTPTLTPTPAPSVELIPTTVPVADNDLNGEVGETVFFGSFEQDNDFSNGKEPIEWIILSKDDEGMLLLSKNGLYPLNFDGDERDENTTWANCGLRTWMNETFYEEAFDITEKKRIREVDLNNSGSSEYGIIDGYDTMDKVFALSLEDAINSEYGFSWNPDDLDINRRCHATAYAKAMGAQSSNEAEWIEDPYMDKDGEYACWWWLRSICTAPGCASRVFTGGEIATFEYENDTRGLCARPAIYVNTAPVALSIVTFGEYEQDNNLSNGAEPIEWIVLSNNGSEMLLLSKYVLDTQSYHDEYVDYDEGITWENCSLRSWLNNYFYNIAFNEEEKNHIIESFLINKDNEWSGTSGGNSTMDNVFILSCDEVLDTDYSIGISELYRVCAPTEYALAHGVGYFLNSSLYWMSENGNGDGYDEVLDPFYIDHSEYMTFDGEYGCHWWLRSPGFSPSVAAFVDYNGWVNKDGEYFIYDWFENSYVYETGYGIRPAIKVRIN